jgi:hypothetical protein
MPFSELTLLAMLSVLQHKEINIIGSLEADFAFPG